MFSKKNPVCKAKVRKKTAFTFCYRGKIYYFDVEACRDTFKEDPGQFVQRKSNRGFLTWLADGSKDVPKSCHEIKK